MYFSPKHTILFDGIIVQTYLLTFLLVREYNNGNIVKTLMENLSFREAAESRRLVRAGADGSDDLVPESVL